MAIKYGATTHKVVGFDISSGNEYETNFHEFTNEDELVKFGLKHPTATLFRYEEVKIGLIIAE